MCNYEKLFTQYKDCIKNMQAISDLYIKYETKTIN